MANALKTVAGVKPHPIILKHAKDHPLHVDNITAWLEHNDALAKEYAKSVRRGHKEFIGKRYIHEGYVKDIRHYIRTGDWISDFFGKNQEHRIRWRTLKQ